MSVLKLLDRLAATRSTKEKESILAEVIDDPVVQLTLELALSPFILFYIKKIPPYKKFSPLFDSGSIYTMRGLLESLTTLSERQKTGNAAIAFLKGLLESAHPDDATVLERVIQKDLRCGVAESIVNKVYKKKYGKELIPTYPVMLATPFKQELVDKFSFPAFAQLKLDGGRFNAIVYTDGRVEYRSRQGREIALHGRLEEEFRSIGSSHKDTVFDGELLVTDDDGNILPRQAGNGILNKAIRGTITPFEASKIVVVLWDVIPLKDFRLGRYEVAYADRYEYLRLRSFPKGISVVETRLVFSPQEAEAAFHEYYDAGLEGIILKDQRSIWEDKRSKYQIKFKGEEDIDVLCTGWIEGTGKYKGMLGALTVSTADGKIISEVGTGFSDADRATITAQDVVGRVVAIRYNSITQDKKTKQKSFFLPRFDTIREDKDKADNAPE